MILTQERCNKGVKEVVTRDTRVKEATTWTRDVSNSSHITRTFNTIIEPHEQRSVYVGQSSLAGGGEGIFAKRTFYPGYKYFLIICRGILKL